MIDKMNVYLSPNRFIPNDYEELSALELIGKQNVKINEVVEKTNEVDVLSKTNQSMKLDKAEYLEDLHHNRKLNETGDFKGSWFGVKHPSQSSEGVLPFVELLMEKGKNMFYVSPEEMADFKTILETEGVLNLRPGEYILPDTLEITGKSVVITSFMSGVAMYGKDNFNESHVVLKCAAQKPVLRLVDCPHSKLENIVFKGSSETINTVEIKNSHWMQILNCGFYGGMAGLYMESSGGAIVRKCQFSTNVRGLHLKFVGDSDFECNYFNTNGFSKAVSETEKYIGVGLLCENGNNNNIRGGKVEWNHRGIVIVATNGVNITGINFDYNRQNHITCVQYDTTPNEIYACKGINIVGNRFLGTTTFGRSSHIDLDVYDTSKFIITGNSFNASGPFAYDSCGADVDVPHHDVGPLRFLSIDNRGGNESTINISGNELSTAFIEKFLSVANHNGKVKVYHDNYNTHENYVYNGGDSTTEIFKLSFTKQ